MLLATLLPSYAMVKRAMSVSIDFYLVSVEYRMYCDQNDDECLQCSFLSPNGNGVAKDGCTNSHLGGAVYAEIPDLFPSKFPSNHFY